MGDQQPNQVAFVPRGALSGVIRPPGSKSITNRALLCSALSNGQCVLDGMLWSEDTEVMIHAWEKLGLKIEKDHSNNRCTVHGCGGKLPIQQGDIYVANSGTTVRFLAAALSACHGSFVMDGVPRMRERPIGDLISALRSMGADIQSLNPSKPDCPPINIDARGLTGGRVSIAGNVSSQFLSGLMMASPLAAEDVTLEVVGTLVSKPYVEMTAKVMRSFGASVESDAGVVNIKSRQSYQAVDFDIEPDASAASYYLAAAAITGGQVTVNGLGTDSMQGDIRFADVLEQMGCSVTWNQNSVELRADRLAGIDVDMGEMSDTVQTLAAVALFADGPTTVRGVEHNRYKETDRITDLARELRRVGAQVEEYQDGLRIVPSKLVPATIQTYNDHRMAMSMSLIGLRHADIWIDNPSCTAKTYPRFFEDMQRCFDLEVRKK